MPNQYSQVSGCCHGLNTSGEYMDRIHLHNLVGMGCQAGAVQVQLGSEIRNETDPCNVVQLELGWLHLYN